MFERRNRKRQYFAFALIGICAFLPFHFSFFSHTPAVSGQALPIESITDSVTWSEDRIVNGIIAVKPGATLRIPRGVTIEFDGKSTIEVEGKLIIEGTLNQPVILKKKDSDEGDSYSITALFSGSIVARNVDISGGGGATEAFLIGEGSQRSLLNRAWAEWFYSGALSSINGGRLDIEGVNFHDNVLAVYANNDYNHKVKVWRSKFERNERDFINGNTSVQSDLRYNWWGSEHGPEMCTVDCDYPRRTLEKIIGGADTSLFARTKYFRNPVIVIPGILGSWKMTDSSDFVLDPILGLYDPLIRTLDENGYERDTNLFVFPYEWRRSNVETAQLLSDRIEAVKAAARWPKVDIVAHSMGGLIAREYIETLDGGGNIDQLITIGTPHSGSPGSYLAWEGGSFGLKLKDILLEKIFQQEAEENGYATIFDYLTKVPIVSVRELLPVYSYLRDESTGELREYPLDYPKNTFLENLNDADNVSKLDPVWFTNIIGKVDRNRTITGLRVSRSITAPFLGEDLDLLWGHGKPDGYDDVLGDQGLEIGSGDGTVPFTSAESISPDEQIELPSAHNDLPTSAAKIVFNRLTGMDAMVETPRSIPMDSMMLIRVFSPIDMQIISPSGKRIGKNFETGGSYSEISGAFYTGYDTKNEFITIPNPEDGEYRILTQGIGRGDYRIEATKVSENLGTGEVSESTATLRGNAEIGEQEEQSVTIAGDTVRGDGTADTTPPMTTASLTGTRGSNDWYTSDVSVTLSALDTDGGSGVQETKYSLDNGTHWIVYTAPLIISTEGNITLKYASTDRAGNAEVVKSQRVQKDTQAPEGKISFNTVTQKLDITGIDTSTTSVQILEQPDMKSGGKKVQKIQSWFSRWFDRNRQHLPSLLATITDEAGHTTSLSFEKTKDQDGRLFLRLTSIAYDDATPVSPSGTIQYKWRLDKKKVYTLFASHVKTNDSDLESHYIQKRSETWIMERPRDLADDLGDDESDRRPLRKKLPGMVIPMIQTEQGRLKAIY